MSDFDCHACGTELAPYAAQESDPGTCRLVEAHLAGCAPCRREYERELDLRRMLAGLPTVTCPPAVTGRVLAAVESEAAAARRRRRFAGTGVALAAAGLAAVLFLRVADAPSNGPSGPDDPAAAGDGRSYSDAEIAAARRELIQTVTLTARVLDQAGRGTFADVFSERLPAAVAGSLRPLDDPSRGG